VRVIQWPPHVRHLQAAVLTAATTCRRAARRRDAIRRRRLRRRRLELLRVVPRMLLRLRLPLSLPVPLQLLPAVHNKHPVLPGVQQVGYHSVHAVALNRASGLRRWDAARQQQWRGGSAAARDPAPAPRAWEPNARVQRRAFATHLPFPS
jgi:hypothetical protein